MRYLAVQNADHWFHNLDKFIHYVNLNASRGGPVVAMYSTPTKYTTVKKVRGKHLFAATFMQNTIFRMIIYENDHFTKRGSGQTWGNAETRRCFVGFCRR